MFYFKLIHTFYFRIKKIFCDSKFYIEVFQHVYIRLEHTKIVNFTLVE